MGELLGEEHEVFNMGILPVKLVLAKVHCWNNGISLVMCLHAPHKDLYLTSKIIHLTTKLLPYWKALCEELDIEVKLLLHGNQTQFTLHF